MGNVTACEAVSDMTGMPFETRLSRGSNYFKINTSVNGSVGSIGSEAKEYNLLTNINNLWNNVHYLSSEGVVDFEPQNARIYKSRTIFVQMSNTERSANNWLYFCDVIIK